MTKEEYEERMMALEKDFDKAKIRLYKEYAFENNPYIEGDLITDRVGTIRILKMQVYVGLGLPEFVYYGVEYTKKGLPTKLRKIRSVYQSNIISKP